MKKEKQHDRKKMNKDRDSHNDEEKTIGYKKEIGDIEEQLDKKDEQEGMYIDQLKRLKAEFENYRKRMEKKTLESHKNGEKNLAKEILVILDNLNKAIDYGKIDMDGLGLIRKELMNILCRRGLSEMEVDGCRFDYNYHHAVGFCKASEGEEDDTVSEVLQQGYLWGDEVLRPAMVVVSKIEDSSASASEDGENASGDTGHEAEDTGEVNS